MDLVAATCSCRDFVIHRYGCKHMLKVMLLMDVSTLPEKLLSAPHLAIDKVCLDWRGGGHAPEFEASSGVQEGPRDVAPESAPRSGLLQEEPSVGGQSKENPSIVAQRAALGQWWGHLASWSIMAPGKAIPRLYAMAFKCYKEVKDEMATVLGASNTMTDFVHSKGNPKKKRLGTYVDVRSAKTGRQTKSDFQMHSGPGPKKEKYRSGLRLLAASKKKRRK